MTKRAIVRAAIAVLLLSIPEGLMADTVENRLRSTFRKPMERDAVVLRIIEGGDRYRGELISIVEGKEEMFGTRAEVGRGRDVRISAINILGELKAGDGLKALGSVLMASDDPSLIFNSARSIGRIGGKRAFEILSGALAGSGRREAPRDGLLKRAAVLGLGLCGDERAIPLLSKELHDEKNDPLLRVCAAGSLGLLGSREGLEVAARGVDSGDPQVKMRSIQALGLVGDESAGEVLELEVENPRIRFRNAAKLSLARVTYGNLPHHLRVEFLGRQLEMNSGKGAFIRWATGELAEMDSPDATAMLERFGTSRGEAMAPLRDAANMRLKINRSR